MFDIMELRQHFARDKRNPNFDHCFRHKSKVFVKVNGPLSSVKFYDKFSCLSSNRNTIYVISEKFENCIGNYETHSEFI